jgi:hypothetical protein
VTNYYEGYARARRVLDAHRIDHSLIGEVIIRPPVRFRVGLSLVSLGHHLMGVTNPSQGAEMRSAA